MVIEYIISITELNEIKYEWYEWINLHIMALIWYIEMVTYKCFELWTLQTTYYKKRLRIKMTQGSNYDDRKVRNTKYIFHSTVNKH